MTIIPASIRNSNPGACYPGPSSRKFGSSTYETLRSKDGVHKIATFPSKVQGAAALFDLLASRYVNMSVEAAITKWCGSFYVSTYLKVLEEKGGIKRTDTLTVDMVRDPAVAIPLAKAMAWQECGQDYPMTDAEWAQAHACAFVEPVAPAFAPGNDVPSPKAETRAAPTVAVVQATAGVAAVGTTLSAIPVPPDLSALTGWQGIITQFQGIAGTISGAPIVSSLIGIVFAALWFKPEIARRLGVPS